MGDVYYLEGMWELSTSKTFHGLISGRIPFDEIKDKKPDTPKHDIQSALFIDQFFKDLVIEIGEDFATKYSPTASETPYLITKNQSNYRIKNSIMLKNIETNRLWDPIIRFERHSRTTDLQTWNFGNFLEFEAYTFSYLGISAIINA